MKSSLQMIIRVFMVLVLIFPLGCASSRPMSPVTQSALTGGFGGAALGAGTGAVIGALITNGDIAASAILGGAIGLSAGLIIGAMYAKNLEDRELNKNEELIETNKEHILLREQEIEELKQRLRDDSFTVELDEELQEDIYVGPSLGNYYR